MRVIKWINKFCRAVKASPLITGLLLCLVILAAAGWSSLWLPSFAQVRKNYRPSDAWIVDRHNYPLESVRRAGDQRSLEWVKVNEISPIMLDLLVEAEDHRFYYHPGVDILAASKALWEGLTSQSFRGASTLTMQLVGLLKKRSPFQRRGVSQKFRQMLLALKMETQWSKEEILEAYLNLAPFRGELIGLRAASLGYFAKNPSGLIETEAAILVALLRSPNADQELVAKRACRLTKENSCESVRAKAREILTKPYRLSRNRALVPVVADSFIVGERKQSVIHSSLDYRIQELAMTSLREQLRNLRRQNVHDGAVLVLDNRTGKTLAYVANAGAGFASAVQVDGIQMRRQAGSTLKPFVYGTAFDLQLLTPEALLEDTPADITIAQGRVYHPKNYDQIFRGYVSVGEALGSSMNVPAVRALGLVGESKVLERLRQLGFKNLQEDDYYGPSLALGAIDVTLGELTEGYRQLAVESSVFSAKTRGEIFNILAAPEYRRFTFGMDSVLNLPFAAAVKTGTSKDMRDNWCIGWTSQYTVGVWVGNFNGDPMWNVSGMSGAAPIWRRLMLALHPQPETVATHYLPPSAPLDRRAISRIRYPAPEMFVGLDPDIPSALQKLPIEIENPQQTDIIYINNQRFSRAQEIALWPLKKGRFRLDLKTARGEKIDSVQFEVR